MSEHQHPDYKKIYFALLALLVVSVAGPFVGIVWVTLITAFGIALVKANLVVQNFMHLKWERRLMKWLLATTIVLMALLVAGTSPDIMEHEGLMWENVAAKEAVSRGIEGEHAEAEGEEEHVDEEAGSEVAAPAPAEADFDARAAYDVACATCHGQAGDGVGPAGAVLDPPPADFTDAAFWATRDTERLFTAIKEGGPAVGGSPLMVGWAASYDDAQIRALVEYLETFRPN